MSAARALVLAALFGLLGLSWWWGSRSAPSHDNESASLSYVATAHQLGIIGYRDPVGQVEPSGARIAYSEGRRVRVVTLQGGISQVMAEADGQIRHLDWIGDSGDLIVEDTGAARRWWIFTPGTTNKQPLWQGRHSIDATAQTTTAPASVAIDALRQIAMSPDGQTVAAVANGREGPEVWRIALDGSRADVQRVTGQPSAPAWLSATEIACVMVRDGRSRLTLPCGTDPLILSPDVDVIGPLAVSPNGAIVYFASPNDAGMVDLWRADRATRRARRLHSLGRDTYAPSMAQSGTMIFKVQSYRTHIAEIDLASRVTTQLTTFQAETPSYDPSGARLAITYGTWRRLMDDGKYPDIAQEIGLIATGPAGAMAGEPLTVIAQSDSEDQAMSWSPNGKWIAFHTHREQSDDVWLRPVDGSAPDQRITFLGRGAEVGWPRWSPDGTMVLLDGASPDDGRSVLFVIGVDQSSGQTSELREISIDGFAGELTHAEWLPDNRTVVAIGKDAPGRHAIVEASIAGGPARIVHRFESEHDFPGLAVSPDGGHVAFVAPADDGYFQIYRMPLTEGPIERVTLDRSHKSQPTWSPDGTRIAFTVWSYQAQFWRLPAAAF